MSCLGRNIRATPEAYVNLLSLALSHPLSLNNRKGFCHLWSWKIQLIPTKIWYEDHKSFFCHISKMHFRDGTQTLWCYSWDSCSSCRVFICDAELEFFRPSSFQCGSSPSGGTYSLAILFFSCTEVLLLFLARLKLFSFNSLLNRCPNFTFGDLQDVAQDAKTIEASSSLGLSSPSNRQITLLCWWPGKKERPMTDYILNRVFSSPLHSMAIMWKWHNTALAKKSVKQISETFGIEFISFLCRTNMWPTTECSCCWLGWPFLISSSAMAQLGLFLWGPGIPYNSIQTFQFTLLMATGRPCPQDRTPQQTMHRFNPGNLNVISQIYYMDEDVSYLWVGQILPS